MRFNLYNDVKLFFQDTYDILMRHEAQNLIPLGNVIIGNEGKDKTDWRDPANWFMATVSDDTGIRLTAIMTPPYNLTLYATDNQNDHEAVACLIAGISKNNFALAGVMAENTLAESFARAYTADKGTKYSINKSQRIYELLKVNPGISSVGHLRAAQENDMAFIPYWIEGFNSDCFGTAPSVHRDAERYLYHISTGKLFILTDNGTPVSMANISREMRSVCGVNYVYTPPYFRGKGYATSCVAAVSRIILERGFSKCVLYTDLANSTSNSIYQKIGYKPICDSLEIKFNPTFD
ncbi:MAG: GNAT family N-acetyltransferase [Clostridiales bacterium]|jgi:predicted GNAT family acetyltransferase|nr:GNAT family N-acetyltransferase [Clostridiales bacterium]